MGNRRGVIQPDSTVNTLDNPIPLCKAYRSNIGIYGAIVFEPALNLQTRMSRIYRDISCWQIKGMIHSGRLKRVGTEWKLDGRWL